MRFFTVKEVSGLLQTNPETVRRWIREHKLKADWNTKKEGNTISENALGEFLSSSPKYSSIAEQNIAQSPMIHPLATTIGLISGLSIGAVSAIMIKMLLDKKSSSSESIVSQESLCKYLKECIKDSQSVLEKKKGELETLTREIEEEETQIKNYNALLERLESTPTTE